MKGSIRKRSKNSWELTIDLGRDVWGKRLRKFVNVKGTKAKAESRLLQLLTASEKGIPLDATKLTVADWLQRWQKEYVLPYTRQRTMERYEGIIRKHITPHVGHVQLRKLTAANVQALEAELLSEGLSTSLVDLVHTIISGALKYAVRMELIWRNVAQAVTPPKVVHKEVEPPDVGAIRQLLNLAMEEKNPLFPCLRLIAYTGIRRGEALGLRWQDVNFEAATISIVQTLSRANTGLIFQPPKTNSGRRTIDLDSGTVDVLRSHRGLQLLQKLEAEGAYQDRGLVFANTLGGPLNPMGVTRTFQALAHRIGVSGAKLHVLRHFHASVLLQQGQSLALVSKRLGHANVYTTSDIYAHILPGWQREAANAFAKAMSQE